MAITYGDGTINPVIIPVGTTAKPFSAITVADSAQPDPEVVTVSLAGYVYPPVPGGLGLLSDPTGGGSFDPSTNTFTESATNTGSPTPATTILNRLVYTPPAVSPGNSAQVTATISVNGTADPTIIQLDTASAPLISGTVSHEPVASGGTISPFGAAQIIDENYFGGNNIVSAAIRLSENGNPTDADGLLTGIGLSKSGTGTYSVAANDGFTLGSFLREMLFTPTAVAAGITRTTEFALTVTDAQAGLSSTSNPITSVDVIGPAVTPTPPLIAGTSNQLTVAPGNAISPFNGVTISDTNANPLDSALLTVTGGGTLTGASLAPGGAPGVYTVAAESPAALTATLAGLQFSPPPLNGQTSNVSSISLAVTDGTQTATDSRTTITEIVKPAPAPNPTPGGTNFTIADQTTGQQTTAGGDPYRGPVSGIEQELILVTPDKLNITANRPNVFIHSGAGNDAIDVSKVNGNNILDGSTGSNFLTGGGGVDTFFLDDRNPLADVFSTIVNFHSGDNATVFGVNATDFTLSTHDNTGAPNALGLDFAFTATGHANANIVLAGFSSADIGNGKLTVTYGTTADEPGLPGSQYMNVHAN